MGIRPPTLAPGLDGQPPQAAEVSTSKVGPRLAESRRERSGLGC